MDKNVLGAKIKRIRQNKGMTMEEFGKLFKANKSNVSSWESGRTKPSNARLLMLAEIGNTTVDELLNVNNLVYVVLYGDDDAVIFKTRNKAELFASNLLSDTKILERVIM